MHSRRTITGVRIRDSRDGEPCSMHSRYLVIRSASNDDDLSIVLRISAIPYVVVIFG